MLTKFADPSFFFLLLFLFPMFFFHLKKRVSFRYSSLHLVKKNGRSVFYYLSHLPFLFKVLAFCFFVIALARPQIGRTKTERKTEGLDMMLVVDTSGSMKALDFKLDGKRQDRLFVLKSVLSEFIDARPDDRLGMIVFGTHAYAQAPLTLDHDILKEYLKGAEIGMAGEATAIGDALGLALSSLNSVKSKNKIIILLTDGANTEGKLDPLQVAQAAKEIGIRVYTIAVGSESGVVPFPGPFGVQQVRLEVDEKLLKEVASLTGGQYFRAGDTEALERVYKTIDSLEKTEVKVASYHNYEERFSVFLWIGFYCFLIHLILLASRLRRIPS